MTFSKFSGGEECYASSKLRILIPPLNEINQNQIKIKSRTLHLLVFALHSDFFLSPANSARARIETVLFLPPL